MKFITKLDKEKKKFKEIRKRQKRFTENYHVKKHNVRDGKMCSYYFLICITYDWKPFRIKGMLFYLYYIYLKGKEDTGWRITTNFAFKLFGINEEVI